MRPGDGVTSGAGWFQRARTAPGRRRAAGRRGPGSRAAALVLRDPQGTASVAILGTLVAVAVFAGTLAPHDPVAVNLSRRLLPPAWAPGGQPGYLLGTDLLGRDVLSRIIVGARVSLTIGFVAATLSGLAGMLVGLAAGYLRGPFDAVVVKLADIQYALPWLVLVIAIIAVIGPSVTSLIVTLALWTWVPFARVVRSETLSVREEGFVEAASALGARPARIMARVVLPNVLSSSIVIWSFTVSQVILSESALSFLGLGVQPPTPSWGNMVGEGRAYLGVAWWIVTMPGLAIALAVLGVNMLGDALRDALDPRLRSRR